jgi:hypothetical protein
VYLLRLAILGVLLFIARQATALSVGTPDGLFVGNLGSLIQFYASETGAFPASWDELEAKYPRLAKSPVKPRERYAFLPKGARPHIRRYGGGELIFISRKPFRNITWNQVFVLRVKGLTEPLRYGLVQYATNSVRQVILREPEVQELFASQKIPLPAPDNLPEREWTAAIARRTMMWRALSIVAIGLCALVGGAKLWRWRHAMRALKEMPI